MGVSPSIFTQNQNMSFSSYIPFWINDSQSPDIFSALFNGNDSRFANVPYYALPDGSLVNPHGGFSVARVLRGKSIQPSGSLYPPDYVEAIVTRLKHPLVPGQTYEVSFDTIATDLWRIPLIILPGRIQTRMFLCSRLALI